jgi:peroxiredoxin
LVQLQADLKKIEAEGIQLVAISYDPVKVLSGFADKRRITFPLLSDPGSKTIAAYGILNKEAAGIAKGVPYPGTFLVDKAGVVRANLFLDGYRERHPTDELLKAVQLIK